jgi:hypothetical protein
MNLTVWEWIGLGVAVVLVLSFMLPWLLKQVAAAKITVSPTKYPPAPVVPAVPGAPAVPDTETRAHQLYSDLRELRTSLKDCPQAVAALDQIILPALIGGKDPPHYTITWDGKVPPAPAAA